MPDGNATPESLQRLLESYRFNYSSELELQEGIARALTRGQVPFEREHVIAGAGRIDFMVGRIGIEIKINGSLANVVRQLHRYTQSDELDALLLVTRRMFHRRVPDSLNGKKVVTIQLLAI